MGHDLDVDPDGLRAVACKMRVLADSTRQLPGQLARASDHAIAAAAVPGLEVALKPTITAEEDAVDAYFWGRDVQVVGGAEEADWIAHRLDFAAAHYRQVDQDIYLGWNPENAEPQIQPEQK